MSAPTETSPRVRLPVKAARELGERAMRGIGFAAWEAEIVVDHAIDAALSGYEYSGLPKLLNVAENPRFARPRRPVGPLKQTGVSLLLDGGNNNGMLAMCLASRSAIELAQTHGVGLVAVTDTWMSGRSAYYVELVARAGLIGIHTVASSPAVAAHGGAQAILGTNPIAFGFPTETDPLVIDMGTSAIMGTDLKFRKRLGIPLPEGVAVDAHGQPTVDAAEALRGAVLPFGGHKGFALSLAMHALGVLCTTAGFVDGKPSGGHLMIAFKPDLFMSLDDYRHVLSDQIARIKAARRQPGVDAIRIPGERSQLERRRLLAEGIEVDQRIVEALEDLATSPDNTLHDRDHA